MDGHRAEGRALTQLAPDASSFVPHQQVDGRTNDSPWLRHWPGEDKFVVSELTCDSPLLLAFKK